MHEAVFSYRRGSRNFSKGGGGVRTSYLEFQQAKKRDRERGQLWSKQVIFNATVCLYLFISSFFNIVCEHSGSCGGEGVCKNLSKTGSFSHKNTQFDT